MSVPSGLCHSPFVVVSGGRIRIERTVQSRLYEGITGEWVELPSGWAVTYWSRTDQAEEEDNTQ